MSRFLKHQSSLSAAFCLFLVVGLNACTSTTPAPVSNSTRPPEVVVTKQPNTSGMHIVRPGETLMAISRAYDKNVHDLIAWNNLSEPNQIKVGQAIRVTAPGAGNTATIVNPIGTGQAPSATVIKQNPRGGTQPYSEQAWNSASGKTAATPPAAQTQTAKSPPGNTSSTWLWPASGAILQKFSVQANKGIDIAGNPGDQVVASAAGKVVYSGSGLRGYGNLILIKHNEDYLTAYAHNQKLLVKEGDAVTRGQKIAELGSSDADRPKLHFEVRLKGQPVDPLKYLPAR